MKIALQAGLLLGLITPTFSAEQEIDFDGKYTSNSNGDMGSAVTLQNLTAQQFQAPLPSFYTTSDGISFMQRPESAEHSISPVGVPFVETKIIKFTTLGAALDVTASEVINGRDYYKFKPNEVIDHKVWCPAESGVWGVCYDYKLDPKFAGHEHKDGIPLYTLNGKDVPAHRCWSNIPVANAIIISFQAPAFATRADHIAEISGACYGPVSTIFDIKIDGLTALPDAYTDSLHGYTTYYTMSGWTPSHPINHFAQSWTIDLWKQIAWQFHEEFPKAPPLDINDISLKWGGLFDVGPENGCKYNYGNGPEPCKFWKVPHNAHQHGRQADVRRNTLTAAQQDRLVKIACAHGVSYLLEKDGELIDPSAPRDTSLDSTKSGPHFHFRFPRHDNEPEDPANEQSTCKEL